MSSFLCFICNNVINSATNEETREKYKEVIGMNLCPYSHLCNICCHMVNKIWLFKSLCVKRTLEYPVLFSDKSTINLHRSDIEMLILCDETCLPKNSTQPLICFNNDKDQSNEYVKLEDQQNDNDDILLKRPEINSIEPEETIKDDMTIGMVSETDIVNDKIDDIINEMVNGDNGDEIKDNDDVDDYISDEVDEDVSVNPETSNSNTDDFKKVILTLEEQKAELDAQRRTEKYIEAEFKCYSCAQGFLFKDSYQTHMMRHEESNGEYVCLLCSLRFANPSVLRAHDCGHRERYTCIYCGVNVRKRQRHTHLRKHKKEEVNAACHLCGNVFQDASGLRQHLKRTHRSKTSNRTYSCSICGKTFSYQAAVRSHMITHIQRKFSCDICSANFSSPYSLNQHKKRHTTLTDTKEYKCFTCDVGYSTKKGLLAHMRRALQHQETVFECEICSRICPNSTALNLHMARIHSPSKDYECNRCTNKYSSRSGLLRHLRVHASCPNTVMAQCFVCGKSFKNNSKLNRHLKEVCRKDQLEEELSAYNLHQETLLEDMGNQSIGN